MKEAMSHYRNRLAEKKGSKDEQPGEPQHILDATMFELHQDAEELKKYYSFEQKSFL